MNWLVTVSAENRARPYLAWLRNSGVIGIAVWPGHQTTEIADVDALLLAGGGDVAPWRYGAETEDETRNFNEPRDEMEIELIRLFVAAGKPVFGICRGIQIMNVALGGGLIQHVPRWLSGASFAEIHHSTDENKPSVIRGDCLSMRRGEDAVAPPSSNEYSQVGRHRPRCAERLTRCKNRTTDAIHDIVITGDSRMEYALRNAKEVNSAHHQAVDPARLALGLRITCLSPAGIIEAIESSSPNGKLSAVQWHPERLPADHPASSDLLRFWVKITTEEAK